jgi:hypothetical protein
MLIQDVTIPCPSVQQTDTRTEAAAAVRGQPGAAGLPERTQFVPTFAACGPLVRVSARCARIRPNPGGRVSCDLVIPERNKHYLS